MTKKARFHAAGRALIDPLERWTALEQARAERDASCPGDAIDRAKLRVLLDGALDAVYGKFPDQEKAARDRAVILRLWADGARQVDVAQEFGLQPRQVGEIRNDAFRKLIPHRKQLEPYLDREPETLRILRRGAGLYPPRPH